jgi:hypothetical protein
MVSAPVLLLAATLRFFGSAGAESQLTPANEASPLNPDNVARVPYQTNAADVSAFGEASAERWKVRVKLRADATDRGADRLRAGEALVQWHAAEWLDLTAGRVIEKWGTGYGWTPTAFVGPAKDPTDPNDRRSAYRGVDMIRADAYVKGTNVSLYALEGGSVAARVYRLIGGTDVSLVWRDEAVGINLSRVFGDALELHGELAREGDVTRAVAGGQYTFPREVNVVLEVYYGSDGLTASEWDAFRGSVEDDLRAANRAYAPLRMGRAYAFVRVHRSFAELIAITNLRDGSTLLRAALTHKLHPSLSVYLIHTEFVGSAGSELAYLQVERVTTAGLRVYF